MGGSSDPLLSYLILFKKIVKKTSWELTTKEVVELVTNDSTRFRLKRVKII